MTYVIASDIHGSALYCRKLLEAFEKLNADKLVLLGDILYHGPRNDLPEGYAPKEVIAMLNPIAEKILCVRGNCDAEVDQMVLNFPIMDEYKELENGVFITHGHHLEDGGFPFEAGDMVFYGHTHVPKIENKNGIVYINPGSVSIPKEDSRRGFILYDGKEVTFEILDEEKHN